jgi:hypothetical protein
MTTTTQGPPVSLAEFDTIFESVKNWGRWGPDDQLGATRGTNRRLYFR